MGLTHFPNGISAQGTATAYGTQSIAAGAGTIATGLSTVDGFVLQVEGAGTATAAVFSASGTVDGASIVVSAYRFSGAAAAGTADVHWTAWGAV